MKLEELRKILIDNLMTEWTAMTSPATTWIINDDNSVHVYGRLHVLLPNPVKTLPFKLRTVTGYLTISLSLNGENSVTNFENFPDMIHGECYNEERYRREEWCGLNKKDF